MAKAPITKRTVDAARPAAGEYVIWDHGGNGTVKGFGLKVTPAGSKKYIFQYRIARPGRAASTAPKKYTIGDHGSFTPEQARKEAKALAAMVEGGIDPRQKELDDLAAADEADRLAAEAARIDRELAFGKFADSWLDHYENEKERRSSSVRLAKLVVNRYLKPALGSKPMPAIGRADLQPIIDGIPAKKRGTRRAVFAYASVLFGWAHKRGDIAVNPVENTGNKRGHGSAGSTGLKMGQSC